jgi:hypothetical protein
VRLQQSGNVGEVELHWDMGMNRPIKATEESYERHVSRADLGRAYGRLADLDVARALVVVIRWGLDQVRDAPMPPVKD